MIDPANNPEFPDTVHTLTTKAVHKLIVSDGRFVTFFGEDQIQIIPSDEIRSIGAKKTPSIWIYLLDDTETTVNAEGLGLTSGQAWVLMTVRVMVLVSYSGQWNNDREQLLRRILGSIQIVIHSEIELKDDTDQTISDNVIQTNRVEAQEVKGTGNAFFMSCDFVFGSVIEQVTQLPVGYVVP